MVPTSSPPADSAAICTPYGQTSPLYIWAALVFLQHELADHFLKMTLDWLTWAKALNLLGPNIWVIEERRVFLEAQDVKRLAQYLADSPELPTLDLPVYGPRSAYIAKRLVNYADEAQDALVELEACPKAYGARVWELVLSLALGNSVANEVYEATDWNVVQGRKLAVDGPNVHARVCALRQTRGEYDFLTGVPQPAGIAGKPRPGK